MVKVVGRTATGKEVVVVDVVAAVAVVVVGQEHGREQELVRGKERELGHGKEQVDDVACEPKPCLDRFHLYI